MRMSDLLSKSMLVPVGNSPGPLMILSCTGGELLIGLPSASRTVIKSHVLSVPSVLSASSLPALSFRPAGVPSAGHSGGGTFAYSLRYQYHERLGIRK